jgi:probable rRNA maturation factor
MAIMKKHSFLTVDFSTTVKLTASEQKKMSHWLSIAGEVVQVLFQKKIIPGKGVKILHVSVLICGDKRIRELNRQFRNKDKVTDVLSFPALEPLRRTKKLSETLFLGDLAICHAQAKRQAKKFGISYLDEFIHLFFHGLIHLLGYDHELSRKEEMIMQKWEDEALKIFSIIKKGP